MENKDRLRNLKSQVSSQNSRARTLGLPATLTLEQWMWALDYWGWRCAVCKKGDRVIVMDHWISLPHPGCPGSVISNIVPLCPQCNLSKGGKSGDVWLATLYKNEDDLAETHQVIIAYFSAAVSLVAPDLSIPETYNPQPISRRKRRTNIGHINFNLDLNNPEQRLVWDYYQEKTHNGTGQQWIRAVLIEKLLNG